MSIFQSKPPRGMEVFVGIVMLLVVIILIVLLGFLLVKGSFSPLSLLIAALLLSFISWFGLLSFRLLLNKPRKDGGLLSLFGLKMGCIFFGVSSIIILLYPHPFSDFKINLVCGFMLVACLFGWTTADKRSKSSLQ